jgi:hypothetical protein
LAMVPVIRKTQLLEIQQEARTRLAAQPHAHSRRSGGRRGGEGRASRCASCRERRESSRGRHGWRKRERERERG